MVLSNEKYVLIIFESLIKLDTRGVIKGLEDLDFIEEKFGLFDILFSDLLDGSPIRAALLLSLVNHAVGSLT
jgi:hypothetical protein